jgi:predicted alpha/beta-hydrolase family hydrolase
MRRALEAGKRPWPPDPDDVLASAWLQVIQQLSAQGVPPHRLFFGGRSMGGRVASYIADSVEPAGMVCISYPFHAPRDPSRAMTVHLQFLNTPTLIVQGERDEYGNREEVEAYDLSPMIRLHWISDGDHSLTPRKRSGRTLADNLVDSADAIAAFIQAQPA